jgi:predicted lipid-binding transport protein (Tim44 family)
MAASYADIIFFAAVAIYLALKLFSVLGRKNDEDMNLESKAQSIRVVEVLGGKEVQQAGAPAALKPQVFVPKNNLEDFKFSDDAAKSGIKEVIEKDATFSLENFVEGAKIAFEMVLKAFSEGDKKTLKELLADDVYPDLEREIDSLKEKNLASTRSLVAIEDAEIVSASVSGSRVRIFLKFLTEQINFVKDADGNVVEGDTKAIISVEDVMGFERNTRSSNPNWTIVSL